MQTKHPKGLYLLFLVEMWERFSYYGMRGILILYLSKSFIQGGLGFSDEFSSHIYGIFNGCVYASPLIGGYIADNYFGKRKSIALGGLLMMLGQFILFYFHHVNGLMFGLFLLAIGNGFFKPNISSLLGDLYTTNDSRKDSAFSIFYMGINLGAFLAPLVIGFAAEDYFSVRNETGTIISFGYKYGFLLAGIGMLLSQIIYGVFGSKYLGKIGELVVLPKNIDQTKMVKPPLTKEEKDKIWAIFIICVFVIAFWTGFEQAGASMTLYTDKYIDRMVGSWLIPTAWFQSVNAFFIIALAPIAAIFWTTRLGLKLRTPQKMGMGLILLGFGFCAMLGAVAQRGGDISDTSIKASYLWLILTYLFHTIGELSLSPVGLSVVTKLSPARMASFFMGVWFLSSAIAHWFGGVISAYVSILGAQTIFLGIAVSSFFFGVLMLILSKKITKLMHGIN